MSFKSTCFAAALSLCAALPAFAGDIMIMDPYLRTAMKGAKTGAAFMQIKNHGSEDDRLIGVSATFADKSELHTHKEISDGVMKMMHVEEGFAIAAGETHALKRGGDHVMLMGLTRDMVQGDTVQITLTFEKAGDMVVDVPVDSERQDHGAMDHSGHGTGG